MSAMILFFAAVGEFPHATANTDAIATRANSFPNVRFISELLLVLFVADGNGLVALGRSGRQVLRQVLNQVVLRLPMPGICHLPRASGRIAVEAPGAWGLSR